MKSWKSRKQPPARPAVDFRWMKRLAEELEEKAKALQTASSLMKKPGLDEVAQDLWKAAKTLRKESVQ